MKFNVPELESTVKEKSAQEKRENKKIKKKFCNKFH